MYYSVTALKDIARDSFRPGMNTSLEAFSANPAGDGLALCAMAPGLVFCLAVKGRFRLNFHCHAWSGRVQVGVGGWITDIDLYAADPAERWAEFDLPADATVDVVVTLFGQNNPDTLGSQAWIKGIEFETLQDWHPKVVPVTRTADIAQGSVGAFLVPRFDEVIGNTIKNTGVWAATDLAFFADHIQPGDTVLDIGANIGHHTVFFAKAAGPKGQVIAFEPQLTIFRYASANAAINGCSNVSILQGCLGEAEGHVRMTSISYDRQTNFGALGVSIGEDPAGELVSVWTLDDLVESGRLAISRIDFVKIDVQSFELYVLRGAERTLRKYKPKIFLEISPYWMKERGYHHTEIYDLLRAAGYSFSHFQDGAGIIDGVRQWSGAKSEEWDVFCTAL